MEEVRLTPRNLFEVDNARNMSTAEVVDTFLTTKSFWRLLSAKNHVVCGARGSGKTVLMKMLGHDHLSQLKNPRAKQMIEDKRFIGIYVPTKIEWVSALQNKPWKSDEDAELFFQWRLNLASCMRLLVTLRSCLRAYIPDDIERARRDIALTRAIVPHWFDDFSGATLDDVEKHLVRTEYRIQTQLARQRITGSLREGEELAGMSFFTELFVPLRKALAISSEILGLGANVSWILCIDEAEFLDESQQRILNTHLRAESGNLYFKISTMPYHHRTLATNTAAELSVGHDFEYVYIDRDLIRFSASGDDAGEEAALKILERRAKQQGQEFRRDTWEWLLGASPLLDASPAEWQVESRTIKLIKAYGDPALVRRAVKLAGKKEFRDQIARKVKPALILREAVSRTRGNKPLDVYTGLRLAIRCCDANPRRLIRLFNMLLLRATQPDGSLRKLSANSQSTLLTQFSENSLSVSQSHPKVGRAMYELLTMVGGYARDQLYNHPLRSDQTSGLEVDESVTEEQWSAIKAAVGVGLLSPQTTAARSDPMPERQGAFHLSYVLAPYFRVLPRRGRPKKLSAIMEYSRSARAVVQARQDAEQLDFGLDVRHE